MLSPFSIPLFNKIRAIIRLFYTVLLMKMTQNLAEFLAETLEGLKAQDIQVIDVRGKSSITDTMIVCTGTSSRHVASTAQNLMTECKKAGVEVFAEEGKAVADWIVVDFGQAIVHILQQESRELYQLEKLWV